jgi:hypothetical protein
MPLLRPAAAVGRHSQRNLGYGSQRQQFPVRGRPALLLFELDGAQPMQIAPGKNALLHCTTAGSTTLSLGHESFAILSPPGRGRQRLRSGSCSSARSFAPSFLPTVSHPSAVALHFARCDQLKVGLPPTRVRPCWAHHHQEKPPNGRLFLVRQSERAISGQRSVCDAARVGRMNLPHRNTDETISIEF